MEDENRMSKTTAINGALMLLNASIADLTNLVAEIQGDPHETSVIQKEKEPVFSLEETLNYTPDKIRVAAENIKKATKEMRSILI